MAITILKSPAGIYPAYNDSFIEFSSNLALNYKAEITVYPTFIFTRKFVVYPNQYGLYTFNLKEAVKVLFNQYTFQDANFDPSVWSKKAKELYLNQEILIEAISPSDSEQLTVFYEFYKAVKQIGQKVHSSPFQLLSSSADGINHSLTYFEGFPFHFDVQKVDFVDGKVLTVKNLNNGNESDEFPVTSTGAFRINVDRGEGRNWTSDNVLPLITGLNRLELYEDGVFKSNINIKKRKVCSGVYLKWFNSQGGFSHFLFEKFFVETIQGADAGFVGTGEFNNTEDIVGTVISIGKDASASMSIKTRFDAEEYELLKEIFTSPLVQIYTSFEANVAGRFIDVSVSGTFSHGNKRLNSELILNVVLPEVITAKY